MFNSIRGIRGVAMAPYALAAQAALAVLRDGGADPRSDGAVAAR